MATGDMKYSARELTKQLKLVAMECDVMGIEDDLVTNAEALARMIWKKALGYTEQVESATGEPYNKTHASAAWAIQVLLERLEGKVATVAEADDTRLTVADKVSDLAIGIVNAATADAVGTPQGPPPLPAKGGA